MQAHMYDDEHLMFRDAFHQFVAKEIVPFEEKWTEEGIVDRNLWQKAGAGGFLSMDVPEAYGGLGATDFRFNAIISEELAKVGASAPGDGITA